MPAAWSYVRFMKVETTASFGIPLSWLFSIHIVFVLAIRSQREAGYAEGVAEG